MEKSILKNLKYSYIELLNKKIVFIISFIFFLVLFSLSKVYVKINNFFQISSISNKYILYSTLTLAFIFLILVISAFISVIIYIFSNNNKNIISSIKNSIRFWLKCSLTILIFIILFNLANFSLLIFTKFMISFKQIIEISENSFRLISFLIYFLWLSIVIIFFTYSIPFMIYRRIGIIQSIKESFKFTKKNYIYTLKLSLLLFLILQILAYLPNNISLAINIILLTPFYASLLIKSIRK